MSNYQLKNIKCPKCGANLEIIPVSNIVECDYCSNSFSIDIEEKIPKKLFVPESQPAPDIIIEEKPVYKKQPPVVIPVDNPVNSGARTLILMSGVFSLIITMGVVFLLLVKTSSTQNMSHPANTPTSSQKTTAKVPTTLPKLSPPVVKFSPPFSTNQTENFDIGKYIKFKQKNGIRLSVRGIVKLKKLLVSYTFLTKGKLNSDVKVYFFRNFQHRLNINIENIREKFCLKYSRKLKWTFIPFLGFDKRYLQKKKNLKSFPLKALLEVILQKGNKVSWSYMTKIEKKWPGYNKNELISLAIDSGVNEIKFKKAYYSNSHKKQISDINEFISLISPPNNNYFFIVNDTMFRGSLIKDKLDYILKYELKFQGKTGIKKKKQKKYENPF
jgi:hypothetical protein